MSRHFGYLMEMGPHGLREADTSTCGHCNRVTQVPPAKNGQVIVRLAAPCGGCHRLVCQECAAAGVCRPFEKWLEEQERRERMLGALGVK